jgi:hypothetical protein
MSKKQIEIHKGCVERIEEMYNQNKNMYKLYQEYFTKYNLANNTIARLKNEVKEKDEIIIKYKNHVCECNCTPIITDYNNNINSYNNYLYLNYNKEKDINFNMNYKKGSNNQSVLDGHIDSNKKNNKDKSDIIIEEVLEKNKTSSIYPNIKNYNLLPTPSSSTDKDKSHDSAIIIESEENNIKSDDIPKSVIEKYPVKVYIQTNSEILQFVSSENKFLINFQYKIAEKLNSKIEDIKMKDIIDFKIKYEGLVDNKDQRLRLKRKIERCKVLYENYGEKLSRFKISLNHLSDMSEKTWKLWLIDFDKIVMEIYKECIKCNYVYKNSKICNKYNCKINHKNNI